MFEYSDPSMLLQIVLADVVLAGDNAIVIALIVQSAREDQRKRMLAIGIVVSAIARIVLAIVATHLLAIRGIQFVGGVLLLWVGWRLLLDVRRRSGRGSADDSKLVPLPLPETSTEILAADSPQGVSRRTQSSENWSLPMKILAADVSMSLDNVLAVAGIARGNERMLAFGLLVSVMAMGFAATGIAALLERYPWLAYAGVGLIVYVAAGLVAADTSGASLACCRG